MKSQITVIISFCCLSIGLLTAWASAQQLVQDRPEDNLVASEYRPPGRGQLDGPTRFHEINDHQDV
jgi:hypothetical protein